MKSDILKYAACAAMALGLAVHVQAAQINGSVGFTGTFTSNETTPGDLTTATFVNIVLNPAGTAGTGDLLGVAVASFNPHILVNNVAVTFPASGIDGLGGITLWSVIGGLMGGYGFLVDTEHQDLMLSHTLTLSGTGRMFDFAIGNDITPGEWQLSFGENGASFRFESTTATVVPDGGMTVMLLGAALSGLALIRRKLA